MVDISNILPEVIDTAREAGELIMGHYRGGGEVFRKEDASPVTIADREADAHIVKSLKLMAPYVPVVSEEGEQPDISRVEYFWLVDPLDGTKSFVRGNGYFTVNIALIRDKVESVLGVIYDPVNKVMYWGSRSGAFRDGQRIHMREKKNPMAAYVSHSHINKQTEDFLKERGVVERIPCASSIKFCFLADGKADIYPRFGPTMEWDVAAGHAILKAAGGELVTMDGKPFLYGKENFLNGDFIAGATSAIL